MAGVIVQEFNADKILVLVIQQSSMTDDADRRIVVFNDRYANVVERDCLLGDESDSHLTNVARHGPLRIANR